LVVGGSGGEVREGAAVTDVGAGDLAVEGVAGVLLLGLDPALDQGQTASS
jgi:hypothetical protein